MGILTGRRGRWAFLLVAALAVGSLLAVACGGDDDDNGGATNTPGSGNTAVPTPGGIDYGSLSGSIRIDGSSTVFPISAAMAEDFKAVARNLNVNVTFSGTGGGFEKFCRGEIEIADASRPIRESEREACADNNIDDIVEIQVAIDALTVVINPNNDWASCMTSDQLHQLFREGGADRWSDIDPSWPNEDIRWFFPGTDSGTYDYFSEAIVGGDADHKRIGGRAEASEDDNILVLGVEGNRYAVGYFGFAYYLEAAQDLGAVSVDDGNGCVEPTFENALAGDYTPLSRPIFIYTRESLLEESDEILYFIEFYLRQLDEILPEVGYVTMPESLWSQQYAKIQPYLQ